MSAVYVNTETLEYPVYQGRIREENPHISDDVQGDAFPNPPPAPYALVENSPVPAHDEATQTVTEQAPEQVDGVWRKSWTVVDLTPEQIAFAQEMEANQAAMRAEAEAATAQIKAAHEALLAAGTPPMTLTEIP